MVVIRWTRLVLSFLFFCACCFCGWQHQMAIYLLYQGSGQLRVLTHTQSFANFAQKNKLSPREKENLQLVEAIKKYSIDSLDFLPTKNFTSIYDQKKAPVLWVITACEPYAFRPYEWTFPLIGQVSYKGFFKKELAEKEYNHLVALGYDVDLRSASAWSTLGWFHDPLLSNALQRSRGGLCNLLFHELFHATYYAPSSVDLNENLANFVADKATQRFLKNDTAALNQYHRNNSDNDIYNRYMLRKKNELEKFYTQIKQHPNKLALKLQALMQAADSLQHLPLAYKDKYLGRRPELLKFKNAYFVDFQQYESMQDSLEKAFNKIYGGDIKKMVQDLRLNKINY